MQRTHFILLVMRNTHFSLLNNLKDIICGHVRQFFTLRYLLNSIFIIFGSKLYKNIVGIPISTNCAPLVAVCFIKRDVVSF